MMPICPPHFKGKMIGFNEDSFVGTWNCRLCGQTFSQKAAIVCTEEADMPINVCPEFMEAAEKHLKEFDPSTDWKDSAMALCVAAFGQRCFELAENGGERALRDGTEAMDCPCAGWAGGKLMEHHPKCDGEGGRKADLPTCPKCGEAATYQTPDGIWWDGNAHYWKEQQEQKEKNK